MELTLREASPLLGIGVRALRAQVARGELAAKKRRGTWVLELKDLKLTQEQRESLQRRSEEVRTLLDRLLPSRAETTRERGRRSLRDNAIFHAGERLYRQLATSELAEDERRIAAEARVRLRRCLRALAVALLEFEARERARRLRSVRRAVARLIADFLLSTEEPPPQRLAWVTALEQELLPPLGGLLRWTERHPKARGGAARRRTRSTPWSEESRR